MLQALYKSNSHWSSNRNLKYDNVHTCNNRGIFRYRIVVGHSLKKIEISVHFMALLGLTSIIDDPKKEVNKCLKFSDTAVAPSYQTVTQ